MTKKNIIVFTLSINFFILGCSTASTPIAEVIPNGQLSIRESSTWGPIDARVRAEVASENICLEKNLKPYIFNINTKKDYLRKIFISTNIFKCVSDEELDALKSLDKKKKQNTTLKTKIEGDIDKKEASEPNQTKTESEEIIDQNETPIENESFQQPLNIKTN